MPRLKEKSFRNWNAKFHVFSIIFWMFVMYFSNGIQFLLKQYPKMTYNSVSIQITPKLMLMQRQDNPVCSSDIYQPLLSWLLSGSHKSSDQEKILATHRFQKKKVDLVFLEQHLRCQSIEFMGFVLKEISMTGATDILILSRMDKHFLSIPFLEEIFNTCTE